MLKVKYKNTMKENVLVVKDVVVQEEEPEVDKEEVVVEVVAIEEVIIVAEVKPMMYLEIKKNLMGYPKLEMKTEVVKEVEEIEVNIVEEMPIKMLSVKKEATRIKDQEVKETMMVKNLKEHTEETMVKMKEAQDVEPEVNQEITTPVLVIDQEEVELKVVTTMMEELEEETEVLDHKLLMTDQPEVDQEVELQEAMVLVEEEPFSKPNELLVLMK